MITLRKGVYLICIPVHKMPRHDDIIYILHVHPWYTQNAHIFYIHKMPTYFIHRNAPIYHIHKMPKHILYKKCPHLSYAQNARIYRIHKIPTQNAGCDMHKRLCLYNTEMILIQRSYVEKHSEWNFFFKLFKKIFLKLTCSWLTVPSHTETAPFITTVALTLSEIDGHNVLSQPKT